MTAGDAKQSRELDLKTISDSVSGPVPPPDRIFADGFEVDGTSHFGTDPRTFTYDVLDRLTRLASSRYGNDDYTYDPLGNVRTATAFGTFHYDATNRMVARNSDPYTYDSRGNLTYGNSRSLTWNRANELQHDSTGNTFSTDARGWRVKRTTTAAASQDGQAHTRYYLYDANHTLMAIRDNGVWHDLVHLGGKTIARVDGNSPSYILPNFQNSPLFETNSAGSITQWAAFLGYGRALADWRAMVPSYTGTLGSATTGEYYLGARHLFHQRFTSPDPAPLDPTSPTGLNRYAYASDNPIRFVDPLGLSDQPNDCARTLNCAGQTQESGTDFFEKMKRGINSLVNGIVQDGATLAGLNRNASFGDTMFALARTAITFSPLALERTAAESGLFVSRSAGDTVKVFRVFGGDARAQGFSWTTKDPRNIINFRDVAGLPSGGTSGSINTANFLLHGEAKFGDIIKSRRALPLDGNKGGMRELIIDPKDVIITDFSVLEP